MPTIHFTVNEKMNREFNSVCKSLGITKTAMMTILVMFILHVSQQGNTIGNIQSLAVSQKKPFIDALLEFLKGRI